MKWFFVFGASLMLVSCAHFETPSGKHYDVLLEGTVFKVMDAVDANTVDAVEADYEGRGPLVAVVSLKIDQVLNGELIKEKSTVPSAFDQAQGAAKSGSFLKLITMDFEKPGEEVDKKWFRVAVGRPSDVFGIKSWEDPKPQKFRLYLEKIPERPGSYTMIEVQPSKR